MKRGVVHAIVTRLAVTGLFVGVGFGVTTTAFAQSSADFSSAAQPTAPAAPAASAPTPTTTTPTTTTSTTATPRPSVTGTQPTAPRAAESYGSVPSAVDRVASSSPSGTANGMLTTSAVQVAAGLGPSASFLPTRLPYQRGDEIPPGYELEQSRNRGLIAGGASILVASYAASLAAAASSSHDGTSWLLVPVVGPFGSMLSQRVYCDDTQVIEAQSTAACSEKIVATTRRLTLLMIDGLAQVAGGSLLVVGLAAKRRELVRTPRLLVSPTLSSTYGLQVQGTF